MTKQEKILEELAKVLASMQSSYTWQDLSEHGKVGYRIEAIKIFAFLHSKDVVIIVDGKGHESQECDWCYWSTHKVEPLIEVPKQ